MTTPLDTARAAWGDPLPDYIQCLAEACTATNQSEVARRLGRSAAMVSTVLRAKYKGDMEAVEDVVRGRLMRATVQCPALGEISTAACRDWMVKATKFGNENSERVRLYRACRSCPRMKKEAAS